MGVLRVRRECLEEMVSDAEERAPWEACGILAGRDGTVTKVYRMRNVDASPEVRYFMEPSEQLRVVKEVRREGLEMLGIYHSHPLSTARPSGVDVKMAFYPEVAYVIVSLATGKGADVKAFRILGSDLGAPSPGPKVEEMALETVGSR